MSAAQIGADDQGVVDIGDLLRILWRGKYIIMVGAIAGLFFGGWFGANKVAPTYTAYAVVVKSSESSPMASLGLDFNLGASGFKSDYQEIIKEQHVLKSRYLMGRVVDTMELVKDPEFNPFAPSEETEEEISAYTKAKRSVSAFLSSINPFRPASEPQEEAVPPTEEEIRDYTVTALTEAVVVESIDDSYVFNISATTYDPDKSAAIANAVADAYIEDQVFSNFQRNEATIKWLSSGVVELKDQLEKAEEAVADFDSKTRLVSEADLAAVTRQIKGQRDRILDIDSEISELKARLTAVTAAESAGDALEMARATGESFLLTLANRASDGDEAKLRLEQELQAAKNRIIQSVIRLTNQKNGLTSSLAELEEQTTKDSADLIQMRQLQREAESAGLIYQFFQSRLNEVAVAQGVQHADSRVLSPAINQAVANTASKSLGSLGFLMGAFLGTVAYLLTEQMNRSVQNAEELETLVSIPVLGAIPVGPFKNRGALLKHISEKPNSEFNEALRNLRTSLFMLHRDKIPQVILTTSSVPGEGKTTTSVSLAMNIAATGKRVLLVECDIRRRMLNHYFETNTEKGIVSLLSGSADLTEVINTTGPGVPDFILGEPSEKNAADLLSSERLDFFLQELRKKYDIIILDAPPVLAVPDARIIAPIADAIIFSAHWNKTPKDHIKKGARSLTQYGIEITGFVLSRVKTRSQRYKYNYGKYDAYYTD
jgi:capsular exopolysaccharide synthesis family protein